MLCKGIECTVHLFNCHRLGKIVGHDNPEFFLQAAAAKSCHPLKYNSVNWLLPTSKNILFLTKVKDWDQHQGLCLTLGSDTTPQGINCD